MTDDVIAIQAKHIKLLKNVVKSIMLTRKKHPNIRVDHAEDCPISSTGRLDTCDCGIGAMCFALDDLDEFKRQNKI